METDPWRLYILELPDSDCKITILRISKKIKAKLEKCNRVFLSDDKIFAKELNRIYRTEKHNNQNKKLNGFKRKLDPTEKTTCELEDK